MCFDAFANFVGELTGDKDALKETQKANKQAEANVKANAEMADQQYNKANGKQPNVQAIDAENTLTAKGGVNSTILTGPQGVDPKDLLLGKTTVLGA